MPLLWISVIKRKKEKEEDLVDPEAKEQGLSENFNK
jgi:hypothetical protein